jgi:glyoxylase-like metal-dependent hydrolase (beta-lactamase superfamily II)
MFVEALKVIRSGEDNGSQTLFRLNLPSGREVVGMATENKYGGEWDLGPTWNYVIGPERSFLVDTGKSGMGSRLLEMMAEAGLQAKDLEFVMLSHGHEDHDGGLAELVDHTGIQVRAHAIYERLCRTYPQDAPSPSRETFSASCWGCMLPESFTRLHCERYHRERNQLAIKELPPDSDFLAPGVQVFHLPGHSPDAVAVRVDDEALIVGDILLPEITPHPSQEKTFGLVEPFLPTQYGNGQAVYGLAAYLRSLHRLWRIADQFPHLIVLPGHRLFTGGHWNVLDLKIRVDEVFEHHLQRCGAIVALLKEGPQTAEELARRHFDSKLLKGPGIRMATAEILSHAEFLLHSQDIQKDNNQCFEGGGTGHFESLIGEIRKGRAAFVGSEEADPQ